MWLEFDVGSLLCLERFYSWYSGFPHSSKNKMTMNQVDEEPLCGCATSKSFIYLFIYFIYNSYLVNESQHLRDI